MMKSILLHRRAVLSRIMLVCFLSLIVTRDTGTCSNTVSIQDEEDGNDPGFVLLLQTNLPQALNRMGISLVDLQQSIRRNTTALDPREGDCHPHRYPDTREILNRRLLIAADPKLHKMFCRHRNVIAFGFCMTLDSLRLDTDRSVDFRLEYDPAFWRSAHLLHMLYLLRHRDSLDATLAGAYEAMIEMRSQSMDRALQSGQKIDTVFSGDSIMALFEGAATNGPRPEFRNALYTGIPGDRTDSFLYRLSDHVIRAHPKNVVLSISGNDVVQGCPADVTQRHREAIVARLKGAGVERIFWLSLPPASPPAATKAHGTVLIENRNIRTLPVDYVDIYTPLVGPYGVTKPQYFLDGGHVTPAAYLEVIFPLLHQMGIE